MAELRFQQVNKVFEDGTKAIHDFSLHCGDGEFVVLVGPSGCGKSTLLRIVAGLEAVSSGEIRIGNRVVDDLPPQARNVAMVFQNYALYPHMTVRGNLAFPLKMSGVGRTEMEECVQKVAKLLGLESLLDHRPRQLSGGQRQRVAMGRALVREPVVFLMDEPLSNLDAKLRVQMRSEITALQKRLGITTLYVTHDQVEAMTMGDRLAVLHQGRLQQCGTPEKIYQQPANVFVATFIGSPAMNLFWATVEQDTREALSLNIGKTRLPLQGDVAQRFRSWGSGQRLLCGLRPEALTIAGEADPTLSFSARVERMELLGHEQIVHFTTDVPVLSQEMIDRLVAGTFAANEERLWDKAVSGRFTARLSAKTNLKPGEQIQLAVNTRSLCFFGSDGNALSKPPEDGRALAP